ncbi:hypothetical protein ABEB36_000248 [Hypothenemus hampei]|uniref:Transposase n=1 Tax=Hypothenemus hampei TaxID=57062 RepID=A0ABD1FAM3_HYPHA
MPNLTEIEKAQIVAKIESGWSIRAVANLFHRDKITIFNIKKRWEQHNSLRRKVGSGRPKISNPEHDANFLQHLRNNPFATARDAVIETGFLGSQPTSRKRITSTFPIDQLESQTRGTWSSYVLGLCFILTIILVATQWKKLRQLKLACQKKSDTNIQSPGPEADPPKSRSRIFEA